ncbi:excisionase family DNA-binding protein [Bacillus haynesii]|uniref:excisionase family DNA-binding protein n=1 Tax=Bacillus haynesii TaxID=1925021 RepID=UPI00398A8A63
MKENYIGHTNLTAKEAAKYFRTSPSTISNLIHEEGMPHLRMGSRYIIVLEEAFNNGSGLNTENLTVKLNSIASHIITRSGNWGDRSNCGKYPLHKQTAENFPYRGFKRRYESLNLRIL